MEFHEKLQTLRKERGLTQDELAEQLFVSRAAVSKWESGRGYPSIDSLKTIAGFFSVSIDDLLSSGEILTVAENEASQKKTNICNLVFGCLDFSGCIFYFLPIFGQTENGSIQNVSLSALSAISPWLKGFYLSVTGLSIIIGVLTLALQNNTSPLLTKYKFSISLFVNLLLAFLFILSRQPYAAAIALIFLIIKGLIIPRKQ